MTDPQELMEEMVDSDFHKEMASLQAETAKAYFEELKEQGFTEEQALELVKSSQPIEVEF